MGYLTPNYLMFFDTGKASNHNTKEFYPCPKVKAPISHLDDDTNNSYAVDLAYNISEVDIDIRQSNGLPAPISPGSTIILKINKTKPVPLSEQKSNDK